MTSPRQARARRTLMTTSIADEKGNTPAAETAQTPKPAKKARANARAAHVAPSKAKAARKASPAKKASKSHKKAEQVAWVWNSFDHMEVTRKSLGDEKCKLGP